MEKTSYLNGFYNDILTETINGEIVSCDEQINIRRNVKKLIKKIGFNGEDVGTELIVMLITDLYYAYDIIDKNIFEDLNNVGLINPLFDLDNEGCPIYEAVINYNGFDYNYMMSMMNEARENSLFKNLSYNQIIYPIVSEFAKRRDHREEARFNELLTKYAPKYLKEKAKR